MSDQHYRMVRELKERRQLDDDQHTLTGDETQISYWTLLDAVPVPGGTPESGDETRLEEAGAEQSNQCPDTHEAHHEAHHLADAPVTDEGIIDDLIHRAKRSATAHIPTTRKSIATRAAKEHKDRRESRYEWWKKWIWIL